MPDSKFDLDPEALAWVDRHNDVWVFPGGGDTDYSFETQPFSREHIEKKWGPLEPLSRVSQPAQAKPLWETKPDGSIGPTEHGLKVWNESQPVQVEVTESMVCVQCGVTFIAPRGAEIEHTGAALHRIRVRAALGGGDHG